MTHPDLDAEQRYLDALHARLDTEIVATEARLDEVRREHVGGLHQARFEREAFARHLEDRLAVLEGHRRDDLCFGRIDMTDGSRYHIGRLGLSGDEQEPLLIDWRAPVAAPFYQATPVEPLGVVRRRHFLIRQRKLVDIEDEVLDVDALPDHEAERLRGEAALQYAIGRARTGRMREVAATLQREQDAVIRAPLSPALFVQGGPGTGKTVVALHRAAYLLYTYRRQLPARDVLVVGPNPVFLHYIENVLPSLGETGVRLYATPDIHRRRAWRREAEPVRSIKARSSMVEVVTRAIATRERPLPRPMDVAVGDERVRITRSDTRKIVEAARRRRGRHNPKAAYVHGRLVQLVWRRAGRRVLGDLMEYEDFRAEMLLDRSFRRVAARIWPLLSAEDLLGPLYGFPALLQEATAGVIEPHEADALSRPWDPDSDEAWTDADAALLDEVEHQLGPIPVELDVRRIAVSEVDPFEEEERRAEAEYATELARGLGGGVVDTATLRARYGGERPVGDDEDSVETRVWRYAIVDEAQDLSPMQWRMVRRHCPRRAITTVGDLAQGTEPWSSRSWTDVATALELGDRYRVAELTVNYRTPAEVAAYGAQLLGSLGLDLDPPEAIRNVPGSFTQEQVTAERLVDATTTAVAAVVADVGEGTTAVVATPGLVGELGPALESRLATRLPRATDPAALDAPVVLAAPRDVKGLEYDAVVLVDPGCIAAEVGATSLYVSATRATRRLHVVEVERATPER